MDYSSKDNLECNVSPSTQSKQWFETLFAKLQTLSDKEKGRTFTDDFSMNQRHFEEENIHYMSEGEDDNRFPHISKSSQSLRVPELKHNHLISPPPSPPEDWKQHSEGINQIPFIDLHPVFLPEANQTILFQPTSVMDMEEDESNSNSNSSSSSSFYDSLSSSSSSVPNLSSPKSSARAKRKQEDQLFRISSDNESMELSSVVITSEEHPHQIIQTEKEARRRRNNSHNYRVSSFSKNNFDDNSEEDLPLSRKSLPSIIITHENSLYS